MATAEPICPLCGGQSEGPTFPFGMIWNGRRFDYLRCACCRSSFIDPVPTDEQFREMYGQTAYHDCYYEDASEEPAPSMLPAMLPMLAPGGRLLDFGCGNGAFLIAARAAGFECEGVELDEETRRRAAANSGCPVLPFETICDQGRKYDVIHLGDVLEHLPDPAGTMNDLRGLLAPGGLFFVEGPIEDNASLVYYASRAFGGLKKLLGRTLHGSLPPYHLFRASARSQRRFFTHRIGWKVKAFKVIETGWPYILPTDKLLRPSSPGRAARMAIGAAGVLLASVSRPFGVPVGNRFAALLSPE